MSSQLQNNGLRVKLMNKEMEFTATTSYALDCREGAIEPFIEEYQSKSESWHAQAQPIPNAVSPHFC